MRTTAAGICPVDCHECANARCAREGCVAARHEFAELMSVCEGCGEPAVIVARIRLCVVCLRAHAARAA